MKSSRLRSTTRPCGRYNLEPNSDSRINHNQLSSGNNLIQHPPPHYTRRTCGRYTTRRGRPLHTTRPCGRYNPIPIPVDGPSSNLEPNSDSGINHNQLSSGNNLIQHPPPHYTRRPCGRYTTRRGRPLHTTRPCGRYNPIPIPVDGPSSNFEPNSDSGINHNQLSSGNNLIQHPPPHYTRRPCGRYTTRRGRPLHTTRPCGPYNPIPIPVDGPSSNFEPNSDSGINHNQLSSGNNLIQHPPPHYTRRPCGRYTTRRGRPLHTTRPCGSYNPIPIPVDGPSSNFEPNSDSGINHNQLSSGNNLIQNPLPHYTRRLRGRYTTLRRRPLPCGSVSTLLNKWVASNPKSKNVITTTIDGLPNNVEQNSDSGVIHNRVSSGSNLIQHSPSHTNSQLVSVSDMSSDAPESACGVDIFHELLAQSTTMGENATTIQNPIVGTELVKIAESVNTNSSVTTTNNSTEGNDKCENGEDGGYVSEDKCENGEEGGYVSGPSNNLQPNSDSGINHNPLFSGNNLIQHPPSHYTRRRCGRYTTLRRRRLPCGSVSTLLNQWVASNPKSKNVITTPIDGLPNNVEQNSDSGVIHNPVSSGSNMIQHSPSHTNSQLVSVRAMSSDAPESASGVEIFHELLAQSTTMGEIATTIQNPIVGTELVKIAESVNTNSSVTTTNNSTEGKDKCENGEDGGYVSEDKCENGEEGGYVSGPSNNLEPNSDSGINHNQLFSGNNLIQHPPSHYTRRRCGRYTTLRRRPLPCGSVSTLLNQLVASNPKSKNVITTPIDGLPNNVEQNSDSGVIHNRVSSGSNIIQHSPSHTNSQLVSVRAMSSDAPESASGVEILHELLAQSTTMGENATTIQNPIVGTELVKIGESVNTNSSVTTTNNSTEGEYKCESGEDSGYVTEDKCENGEDAGYVSGPSNNLEPNSDSGINHNQLSSGNNLIQHPPSHYTPSPCGHYTTLHLNQWVASNPKSNNIITIPIDGPSNKSKNIITIPIDGPSNNLEQNSDSRVIHDRASFGNNLIQHPPSHTNSAFVSVRAMSSDAPESASGVEISHELLAQSRTMGENATTIQNPIVGTELIKIGESLNTNSCVTTTNNSTEGEDKCENVEDGGFVCEDIEDIEQGAWQRVSHTSDSIKKDHDDMDDDWVVL